MDLLEESFGSIRPVHENRVSANRLGFRHRSSRPERELRRCAQIKFALPRRSRPTGYVVAERRLDALASCYPSNQLAWNLVILRKAELVARRSNAVSWSDGRARQVRGHDRHHRGDVHRRRRLFDFS